MSKALRTDGGFLRFVYWKPSCGERWMFNAVNSIERAGQLLYLNVAVDAYVIPLSRPSCPAIGFVTPLVLARDIPTHGAVHVWKPKLAPGARMGVAN